MECVWETGRSAVEEHAILPWDAVFASVSVIVLVTQELIVEARESIESSEDLQCVTIWLFIGLLLHSL